MGRCLPIRGCHARDDLANRFFGLRHQQGDDPGERAAFELVPRFLQGVRAEPYDHSGRQAAVDALLQYPDGRIAAVEVTSAAADGQGQLYALLGKRYKTLEPLA